MTRDDQPTLGVHHFLEAEDIRVVELRHELDLAQRRQGKLSRATESPSISDDGRERSCINGGSAAGASETTRRHGDGARGAESPSTQDPTPHADAHGQSFSRKGSNTDDGWQAAQPPPVVVT